MNHSRAPYDGRRPVDLSTERLVLTPPSEDDFKDIHDLWNDPVTLAFLGRPSTMEEAWVRVLKYVGHWSLFGFGFWMLREAATGRFVGEAGLAYHKRDNGLCSDPEAGWALKGSFHGKGYGREALVAILAWADLHLATRRLICLVDPANVASVRLAESTGFRRVGETGLGDHQVGLFERFGPSPNSKAQE